MKRRKVLLVVAVLNFLVAGFLLYLGLSKTGVANQHATRIEEIDRQLVFKKQELSKMPTQADKPLTIKVGGDTRTIPSFDAASHSLKSEIYSLNSERQTQQRRFNSANSLSALARKSAMSTAGIGILLSILYFAYKKRDSALTAANSAQPKNPSGEE